MRNFYPCCGPALVLVAVSALPIPTVAEPSPASAQALSADLPSEAPARKLVLSTFAEVPTHSFLISTEEGRINQRQVSQRVQYNPTFGPNLGVRASYEPWSISFSKQFSFINEANERKYGRSASSDWRLGYRITKNVLFETYYQNYRGFYTDLSGQEGLQTSFGSTDVQETDGTSQPAQPVQKQIVSRPDLSALNYGVRATYVIPLTPLFKEFSTSEEAKSLSWDIDFLTKAYYNRLSLSGDRPLVPASTADTFSPIASLKEYQAHTLGVGAGLGVSIPASRTITVGFNALLGVGLQRQTNVYEDQESASFTTGQEMNANVFMDWRGDAHGVNLGLYMDTFSSKVKDAHFDNTSLGVALVYSYSGFSI